MDICKAVYFNLSVSVNHSSTAPAFLRGSDLLASAECLCVPAGVLRLPRWLTLSHIVLDFTGHGGEGRLDILALLGRRLKEAHAVVVGHLLALLKRDGTSVLQIGLVSDQDSRDVILSVLFDFGHPGVHSVEGVAVGDVVNDDNAMRAFIIARSDSLESFLAGRVPDLQLADFLVDVDGADFEVDANGRHEVLLELVVLIKVKRKGEG